MDWSKIVGPATLVYLISASVGGVWWASDISARVAVAERQALASASTPDRLTRLESTMIHIDKQLDRIETKLDSDRR